MNKERNYLRGKALLEMAGELDSWYCETKEEEKILAKVVNKLQDLALSYMANSDGYEDEYGKALAEYYGYNK